MKIYKITSEDIDMGVSNDSSGQILDNIDEKYMELAENPEENHEELQRMVDEAAQQNGLVKVFHGTTEKEREECPRIHSWG